MNAASTFDASFALTRKCARPRSAQNPRSCASVTSHATPSTSALFAATTTGTPGACASTSRSHRASPANELAAVTAQTSMHASVPR